MQSNREICKWWRCYGLEIRVQYRFIGAEKAAEWGEKNIIFFWKNK